MQTHTYVPWDGSAGWWFGQYWQHCEVVSINTRVPLRVVTYRIPVRVLSFSAYCPIRAAYYCVSYVLLSSLHVYPTYRLFYSLSATTMFMPLFFLTLVCLNSFYHVVSINTYRYLEIYSLGLFLWCSFKFQHVLDIRVPV